MPAIRASADVAAGVQVAAEEVAVAGPAAPAGATVGHAEAIESEKAPVTMASDQ
jgi:hypothetical protein